MRRLAPGNVSLLVGLLTAGFLTAAPLGVHQLELREQARMAQAKADQTARSPAPQILYGAAIAAGLMACAIGLWFACVGLANGERSLWVGLGLAMNAIILIGMILIAARGLR